MNDEVKRDFAPLEETEDGSEAVIIGDLGEAFSYDVLNRAFREVMNGAELIALQKNRYWLRTNRWPVARRRAVRRRDRVCHGARRVRRG
jgi:hypothetical protein